MRYRDFYRHARHLWMEHHAGWVISDYERQRMVDSFNDTVFNAEMAWPGTGTEWPHSVSGGDHLCEHVAHDLALPEHEEITFRQWWAKVCTHGFGTKPLNKAKDTA